MRKENTVRIEKLVFEGKGLGHTSDGKTAFVVKTLPGEEVEFDVIAQKRKTVQGWPTKFIKKSKERIEPKCPYFDQCRGCSFQHMEYEKQCFWKNHFLTESMTHIGGFDAKRVEKMQKEIEPAQTHFHYRNKTEFSFSDNEGELLLGFHDPRKRFYVLHHDKCVIHTQTAQKAFQVAQKMCTKSLLNVFDLKVKPYGFLFSLTFRTNHKDEILVIFNTNNEDFPAEEKDLWIEGFKKELGSKLIGIIQVQKDRTQTASPQTIHPLWGKEYLEEEVGDLKFKVGAISFFQVNREMAGKMVHKLREKIVDIARDAHVLDLFCGNGFLGMAVAKEAQAVTGIEINASAVAEGKENLKLNKINNYTFYEGDARKTLNNLLERKKWFDVVIVDPPRGGLGRRAVKTTAKVQCDHIFYISCNPTTLARDLEYFEMCGYEVQSIQAMDLFPQTYHLETFCVLKKKKSYAEAKKEWIEAGRQWK